MILIIIMDIFGLRQGRLPLKCCAGPSVVAQLLLALSWCLAAIIFHNYHYFHGQTHLNFSHLSLSPLPSYCQQR